MPLQFYFAGALTLAALVGWVFTLRASLAEDTRNIPVYALSTIVTTWLVAMLTPQGENTFFKAAVVLGMLLALIAVALRASQFLPGYTAHFHLAWTYILYAFAFASQTHGWPTPYALVLVVAAGLLYAWLQPGMAELWSSVAIYGLLLFFATWQALEFGVQHATLWLAWSALVGMLLIVAATLLEGQARFRQLRTSWVNAALPLLLLAQLAIAWSIWV
jgi:uncharacterized membrane protein YhhN